MVLWACVDECEEVQMNILLRLTEGAAHSVYTGGGGGGGGGGVTLANGTSIANGNLPWHLKQ